jgi:hypothetical protein
LQILYLLILEELAEMRCDFTAECSTEKMASQVTVLRMNKLISSGDSANAAGKEVFSRQ